jgi:hypothetical protein
MQHLGALLSREWFLFGDEREEAAQSGEPAVSSDDRGTPFQFQVLQKREDLSRCEVFETEIGHLSFSPLGYEAEKQPPRIPVGAYSPKRGISLLHEPKMKEGVEQSCERWKAGLLH